MNSNPPEKEDQKKVAAAFSAINLVLICIVFTVIILAVIPQLGILNIPIKDTDYEKTLKQIFLFAAVGLTGTGLAVRSILLKPVKKDDPAEHIKANLRAFHLGHLVPFVIFESIALLGFVVYMLSGDTAFSLLLCGLSIGCMTFTWPKINQLRERLNKRK